MIPNHHPGRVVPSECFAWDKDSKTLSGCISDTPLHGSARTPFSFMIKSARTGDIVAVRLDCEHHDGTIDNELTHWTYKPVDKKHTFRVKLFND